MVGVGVGTEREKSCRPKPIYLVWRPIVALLGVGLVVVQVGPLLVDSKPELKRRLVHTNWPKALTAQSLAACTAPKADKFCL